MGRLQREGVAKGNPLLAKLNLTQIEILNLQSHVTRKLTVISAMLEEIKSEARTQQVSNVHPAVGTED